MPSHVPRTLAPVKQQETLAKREARLKHAIASLAKPDALDAAAEDVRKSQLSILKARRELHRYKPQTPELAKQLESIDADDKVWREISVHEILRKYE